MKTATPRAAWLSLAHAFPADPALIAGLRSLEPDLDQLGHRLAECLAGNDHAFDDLVEDLTDEDAIRLDAGFGSCVRAATTADRVAALQHWVAQDPRRHLLTPADTGYPTGLLALDDAPPMLTLTGQPEALNFPGVGIVGSRNASRVGLATSRRFARELSSLGFAAISGLAIGIDAAAHAGALDDDGVTVAVSATGPDRIYPARHAALAAAIIRRGAVVSEYPLNEGVHRARFPQRNRLIAALGYGVILVEAARRSGTLSTAGHAADLGKPVMPVPGTVTNSNNGGCHDLIRDGAPLVESTEDVIALIADSLQDALSPICPGTADSASERTPAGDAALVNSSGQHLDADARNTLDKLHADALTVDTLCALTALPAPRQIAALTRLEMTGLVEPLPDGRYTRCLR